jgi:muconolactone D-isomerase
MVRTIVTLPTDETSELAQLREAERARADALQREGTLVVIWRDAEQLASFGIWRGEDKERVRSEIVGLPMYRYMDVTITEIERHPNAIDSYPFGDR